MPRFAFGSGAPLLAVLLFASSGFGGTADFRAAYEAATRIDGLGRFLEQMVGSCESSLEKSQMRACLQKAERARREARDTIFLLSTRDLRGKLSEVKWSARENAYRVLLTPIFGSRGLGLTLGKPVRLDGAGNPVVPRRPIFVKRPPGTPEFIFRRDLERGMVKMDLLVVVSRTWRLRRSKAEDVRGLSVRLRGLRLQTRDAVLLEQMYDQ